METGESRSSGPASLRHRRILQSCPPASQGHAAEQQRKKLSKINCKHMHVHVRTLVHIQYSHTSSTHVHKRVCACMHSHTHTHTHTKQSNKHPYKVVPQIKIDANNLSIILTNLIQENIMKIVINCASSWGCKVV